MFTELLKNKKMIAIFVFIILFLLFVQQGGMRTTIENFENGNTIDTIMNSFDMTGQKFNDVFTKIDANTISIGKNISTNKNIETSADINAKNLSLTGSANITGNISTGNISTSNINTKDLKIGNATLGETELKKLKSLKNIAGYALDGSGSTHLLFEGYHKLSGGAKFDAWSNNKWDKIYIFKGWKITAWKDNNKKNKMGEVHNKDQDAQGWGLTSNVLSEYEVVWAGY